MTKILDDFSDLEGKRKQYFSRDYPNKWLGRVGLLGAFTIGIFLVITGRTSETNLVLFSYLYIPLLTMGVLGYILPPKKVFLGIFISFPILFVFYELIFPAL